tara:strand:- start:55 stop:444 length:390 start_codon:yes stop_codon:yes gene_type:complete
MDITKTKKILVVDDEKDIQPLFLQMFRLEIKKKLVEFDFAFSGFEALNSLSKAQEKDYILILSDINMPGMSGLDLLKEIKSTYKSQKVMIITAFGDEDNYTKAVEYGANDFLVKPIDFKNLKSKILCIS